LVFHFRIVLKVVNIVINEILKNLLSQNNKTLPCLGKGNIAVSAESANSYISFTQTNQNLQKSRIKAI